MVTAAELLSVAAFDGGRYAQAFPSFGSERTGAPVVAFCRVDDKPIRTREPIAEPDAVIVQDPTLIHQVDLFSGLSPQGYVLVNTVQDAAELGLAELVAQLPPGHAVTVPATDLALEHIGRPVPNAVLLGALSALTELVPIDAVAAALTERFPAQLAAGNVAAARAAHDYVLGLTSRENVDA